MTKKIKIIYASLFIPFLVLLAFSIYRIKHHEIMLQKVQLAGEIRRGLEHLMLDLSQARENTILYVPADGQWHGQIAFVSQSDGAISYKLRDGQLLRISAGRAVLIAEHIRSFRMRRLSVSARLIEVEIIAQKGVALNSNLKIRISH